MGESIKEARSSLFSLIGNNSSKIEKNSHAYLALVQPRNSIQSLGAELDFESCWAGLTPSQEEKGGLLSLLNCAFNSLPEILLMRLDDQKVFLLNNFFSFHWWLWTTQHCTV